MPNQSNPINTGAGIYSTGVVGGGTWIYTGGANSAYPQIYNVQVPSHPAYVLLRLPTKHMPDLVFLNGRALTLGALGSKADVAFGYGDLIFSGKLLAQLPFVGMNGTAVAQYTFILQYRTRTYHYTAEIQNDFVALKPNSNIIDLQPLCEIKRL